MHALISLSGVSFEFSNGHSLFSNLNFSLGKQVTALVGPNGIGKTTLAELITGSLEATAGSIHRSVAVSYLRQRELPPRQTIAEYLSDVAWSELGHAMIGSLKQDQYCDQLSGGEWMRVRLAKSINAEFLILDEPTNDLDREGRAAILEFLRRTKIGVLLISHDRECLKLCNEVLELSKRGLTIVGGNWSSYEKFKKTERENLAVSLNRAKRIRDQAFAKRHSEIAKQEKRNSRGEAKALRGGAPRILIGAMKRKAQVTTAKIDVATLDRANEAVRSAFESYANLKVDPVMYAFLENCKLPAQKLVAEAQNFNVRFYDWLYTDDVNFSWRGNIRVAIKGANGSGKSTLLKAILGQNFESRGQLRRGKLKVLHVDQGRSNLDEDLSVFENIKSVSGLDDSEIRNGLAKFLFMNESVFQKVSTLSGGERLRASLAKGLLVNEKPELVVLDEPTNNLDLSNVEFLESLVSQFPGAVIVVSHDEVFLSNCQISQELVLK